MSTLDKEVYNLSFNNKYSNFDVQFLKTIDTLKKKIIEDIKLDYKIRADPYDNAARLKTCEKIEKIYFKLKKVEDVQS